MPSLTLREICMLHEIQVKKYLERLSYAGSVEANVDLLMALHRAHLHHIAFENLDIILGKKIALSREAILDKILILRRGGFCYELNYAFSLLLKTLGFDVQLLAANVFNGQSYGQEFDHMLLLVHINKQSWIADVGFGDCFRTPMLIGGDAVEELGSAYKIVADEDHQILMHRKAQQEWQPEYRFSLIGHGIADFLPMCDYQQSSPDSHFTKKSICSIATKVGRISISNGRLIRTQHGERSEQYIQNDVEYRQFFAQHFDMQLPPDADIKKLLRLNEP
jgi:N-hydroxyarylamine O-acetyltransferase